MRSRAPPIRPGFNGQPVFDPNKLSASWLLFISTRHQPRLLSEPCHASCSTRMAFRSGRGWTRQRDTLNQLRGEAERPKNADAPNDLPIPTGLYASRTTTIRCNTVSR